MSTKRTCYVSGCSNSDYRLHRWSNKKCKRHGSFLGTDTCNCAPPFKFFNFPTEKKEPEKRQCWLNILRRSESKDNLLQPSAGHRVCSDHFVDGCPTPQNPDPARGLCYNSPESTCILDNIPQAKYRKFGSEAPEQISEAEERGNPSPVRAESTLDQSDRSLVLDFSGCNGTHRDISYRQLPRRTQNNQWLCTLDKVELGKSDHDYVATSNKSVPASTWLVLSTIISMLLSLRRKATARVKQLENDNLDLKKEVAELRCLVFKLQSETRPRVSSMNVWHTDHLYATLPVCKHYCTTQAATEG